MERYSDYLFNQLDDLTSRARILRSEALRLEAEKAASESGAGGPQRLLMDLER